MAVKAPSDTTESKTSETKNTVGVTKDEEVAGASAQGSTTSRSGRRGDRRKSHGKLGIFVMEDENTVPGAQGMCTCVNSDSLEPWPTDLT